MFSERYLFVNTKSTFNVRTILKDYPTHTQKHMKLSLPLVLVMCCATHALARSSDDTLMPEEEATSCRRKAEIRRAEAREKLCRDRTMTAHTKEEWTQRYRNPPKDSIFDTTARQWCMAIGEEDVHADFVDGGNTLEACAKKRGWAIMQTFDEDGDPEVIGKGAYGEVVMARASSGSNRAYVLKNMLVQLPDTERPLIRKMPVSMETFLTEVRSQTLAADLGLSIPVTDYFLCPNARDVKDYVEGVVVPGVLVMPWVDGSLRDLAESQESSPGNEIRVQQHFLGMYQSLSGNLAMEQLRELKTLVLTAHHAGILARDAHFENVLYDSTSQRFVLIDYGQVDTPFGEDTVDAMRASDARPRDQETFNRDVENVLWDLWKGYALIKGYEPSYPSWFDPEEEEEREDDGFEPRSGMWMLH